jgi:hypothetical protein
MKKGTQIFICGSVDVILTFVMICWLLFISQGYNSIQWIIIVLGWIVLFSKILFWDRMLKNYVKKYTIHGVYSDANGCIPLDSDNVTIEVGNIIIKTQKKYIHPKIPIRIGDTTFDIKVEKEGLK